VCGCRCLPHPWRVVRRHPNWSPPPTTTTRRPANPALHHLTSPMRRATTAAGDPEHVNLWAGTGYPEVREHPAAETLAALARDL
jgi:hypothetical protein